VWLIYPRHCTPIPIKIGQRLLKLCTKVFWCVFMPHSVYINITECTVREPLAVVRCSVTGCCVELSFLRQLGKQRALLCLERVMTTPRRRCCCCCCFHSNVVIVVMAASVILLLTLCEKHTTKQSFEIDVKSKLFRCDKNINNKRYS